MDSEWERAAQGETPAPFPWGVEAPGKQLANLLDRDTETPYFLYEIRGSSERSLPRVEEVGRRPASASCDGSSLTRRA